VTPQATAYLRTLESGAGTLNALPDEQL
jgi:hypothetical protein